MTTINGHITRAVGTVLSAAIYNADHVNHITNANTLNAAKMEGATPPVADGDIAVFSGTSGVILKTYGAPPLVANAALFTSIKQVATTSATGVIELAVDSEVRASTAGNLAITPAHLDTAAAQVTLTDAATIAVDWASGINFIVTMAANRILGFPTNIKFGQYRTFWVQGNDATPRTLTFAAGFLGSAAAAITGITSTVRYIITVFALNSSNAALVYPKSPPF